MQKHAGLVAGDRPALTEEEAWAIFECTARDLLRLSAAGFLAKLKRGEFQPLNEHQTAKMVAEAIPASVGPAINAFL